MADDGVTDGQVLDRRADRVDPAGVLVPENKGQIRRDGVGEPAVDDVQIGAAQPGAADPDDYIVLPGCQGFRHLVQLGSLPIGVQSDRFHGALLSGSPACAPVVAIWSRPGRGASRPGTGAGLGNEGAELLRPPQPAGHADPLELAGRRLQ